MRSSEVQESRSSECGGGFAASSPKLLNFWTPELLSRHSELLNFWTPELLISTPELLSP